LIQLPDPFAATPGFQLDVRIRQRAAACGIELSAAGADALAEHARWVLRDTSGLHLTSITDPAEFVERHIGEAFEGAAALAPQVGGLLLDLGSGNGYPALPISVARPGLRVLLSEASHRRSVFLRTVIRRMQLESVSVLEGQVQRPSDIEGTGPLRVLTTRAMGGWPKVVPRLVSCLEPTGEILVWAGDEMQQISRRVAWRRLQLDSSRPLPGRERSWVWIFRAADKIVG
jgi:16S rRNA (guanine527-N7)-methyltransferase